MPFSPKDGAVQGEAVLKNKEENDGRLLFVCMSMCFSMSTQTVYST